MGNIASGQQPLNPQENAGEAGEAREAEEAEEEANAEEEAGPETDPAAPPLADLAAGVDPNSKFHG